MSAAPALRADGAESTPGSDNGEIITRLFPKCRPKNMHHHGDRLSSGLEGRKEVNINNFSSDDERNGDNLVILNSKGDSYKLRDSRIIEIAGGRELYSQSRTKAVRKLRHSANHKHNIRNKVRSLNKETIDNITSEIPFHRVSALDSKEMVSRHTSPVYVNGDQPGLGIPRNSSPILDPHKIDVSNKGSPIAVVADGHVVVLHDNDDWKGLRNDPPPENDIDKRTLTVDNIKNSCDSDYLNNKSDSVDSEVSERSGSAGEGRGKVRVIGELPIAEYEGSPRRYGRAQLQVNARSPRPGFPRRVLTESGAASPPSCSPTFDYLYEFSETRKVLEEFFKGPGLRHQNDSHLDNFQELEYELRRQTLEGGSECGAESDSEAEWRQTESPHSPHLAHNHTNFLGLQQRAVCAAGKSGAAAGDGCPALGLSPGTSDAGDVTPHHSDLDLILMENELAELKGIAECSRSGGGVQLPVVEDGLSSGHASDTDNNNQLVSQTHPSVLMDEAVENGVNDTHLLSDADLHSLDPLVSFASGRSPPPPAPASHRGEEAGPAPLTPHTPLSPVTPLPANTPSDTLFNNNRQRPTSAQSADSVEIKQVSGDEDEADTDLETDRLLGQQRTDDQGFFDDKGWRKPKSRTVMPAGSVSGSARSPPHAPLDTNDVREDDSQINNKDKENKKKSKNKEVVTHSVLIEGVLFRARYLGSTQLACEGQPTKATRMLQAEEAVSRIKWVDAGAYSGVYAAPAAVFRLSFLGSVELDDDSRRQRRRLKKYMVEEAVAKIKAPEGENQPSTEVDLFISTEKIMVLNTELKEIMMDHALRTISYIADIGDLVVLMARRRFVPHDADSDQPKLNRTPKMICHVFESEEAQFIAQSIGQAFQVAYMEFLKANGIEDHSFVKEMDYQEVLNSQEIFGDELQMFAKKELQKEVVVPKAKGEILGVVVVESGWGSMLPTVVIANLAPAGAAARCGQLNIGDQIIAINGVSLVGLPLSTCQTYIKNSKNQTVVKLTVVPCAPVVEVKIKRPDTKYQLGFSVQNGVICSLLRGGIAERGGVRVGHRIIEINSQSVVAVPHERIVNLLATSVGEILMKTMPTSMFRLLTGQENPVFI